MVSLLCDFKILLTVFNQSHKGQLISKANCQAEDSSKKRTNEFVFTSIVWCVKNRNYLYSKIVLVKCSGNNFIFLPVFYLNMCFMKEQKNFGKITILKIWGLFFLGNVKYHFGKLAKKWCIFRHDKKMILTNIKM